MNKVEMANQQAQTDLKKSFVSVFVNSMVIGAVVGVGVWALTDNNDVKANTPATVVETPTKVEPDIGNWKVFNWVDEFGDETGKKGMRLHTQGLFSNSATKPKTLQVATYYKEYNWGPSISFRFQEYAHKGWEKGVFDQSDWKCSVKNENTDEKGYRFILVQYKNSTDFSPATSGTIKMNDVDTGLNARDWLIKQAQQENEISFVCNDKYSTRYVFSVDFNKFNNAKGVM